MHVEKKILLRLTQITALILSVILPSLVLYRLNYENVPDKFTQSKIELEVLIQAAKDLGKIWESGDIDSLWKKGELVCPKHLGTYINTSDSYLRCNPGFMECYFEKIKMENQPHLSVAYKGKKYDVYLNKNNNQIYFKLVTRSIFSGKDIPIYGVEVELFVKQKPNLRLKIFLNDTCSEALLPERIYGLGEMPKEYRLDWKWDSLNRKIYLDKYLVSNRDITEWMENDESIRDKIVLKNTDLPKPATKLSIDQMKKYCRFRGKELASAQVFDAATFLPFDLEKVDPKIVMRSPWHFSKITKDGPLYKASMDNSYVMVQKDCLYAYTKECLKITPYENYNSWSPSFIGINGSLGGYMEIFTNIIYPEENLKASSFYFPAKEMIHRLGKKAYWDMLGLSKKNFKLDEGINLNDIEESEFEIGFRCMRQYEYK